MPAFYSRVGENAGKLARMIVSVAPAGLEKILLEVGQPVAWGQQTLPPSKAEIGHVIFLVGWELNPCFAAFVTPPPEPP